MRNIKLLLEYDGSRYSGWQRLGKNESSQTIENKLLEVIQKMTGENVDIFCGSRTESGVHAYGQVVHFKTNCALKPYEIKQYLNRYLPMDIAILDVEDKPERFHASLNATSRKYVYRIALGEAPSVFDRKYVYYCFKKPNVDTIKKAAEYFIGKHDFCNFTTGRKNKSTVKEIYDIDVYADEKEIQFTIHANDFLHNMARIMIATLLDAGLSKREVDTIPKLLDTPSKEPASAALPSQGLFLLEVCYEK